MNTLGLQRRLQHLSRLFLLCLALWPLLVANVEAQERSDQFFDKNFATGSAVDAKRGGFFDSTPAVATKPAEPQKQEEEAEASYREAVAEEVTEAAKASKQPPSSNDIGATARDLLRKEGAGKQLRQSKALIDKIKALPPGTGAVDREDSEYFKEQVRRSLPQRSASTPQKRLSTPIEAPKGPQLKSSKNDDSSAPAPAVLSLVVNAHPREHFLKYLRLLSDLKRRQNVDIGEVLVVYPKPDITSIIRTMAEEPEMNQLLATLKGEHFAMKPVFKLPKHLPVKSSPAWIVECRGKNHIFEGSYNPARLFNNHGEFVSERSAAETTTARE